MEEAARLALDNWVRGIESSKDLKRVPGVPGQALIELSKLDYAGQTAVIDEALGKVSDQIKAILSTLLRSALTVQVVDHSQGPIVVRARSSQKTPATSRPPQETLEGNEPLRRSSYLSEFGLFLSAYKLDPYKLYVFRPTNTRFLALPTDHPVYQETSIPVLGEALLEGHVLVQEWETDRILFVPAKKLTALKRG